ncbi:MAG: proline--tRNA ligase [Gammaproteobacteria bacterium]
MSKTAITPTRQENYPEWYQQVIQAADLAEHAPVRGCMIIKPWGYAIWENMQRVLDGKFKATGHKNAYFPLLIPLEFLQREAEHVEGFAKECAVVTHHRLVMNEEGKLIPGGELEEPLIIRPTSETIIGVQFGKWVQSYRDLPLKINQWANVMRWEMRTRLFLRTSEFLWQEGHTAHSTSAEAQAETRQMLEIYAQFAQDYLAIPVIMGEKTADERFPGAENTFTIEAMMQDHKALQAGTSHFMGQNFAKSFGIQFANEQGQLEHAWTTSWGLSTRMIGGLIMTHSDDNGLVLPPRITPTHIIILPIYRSEEEKAAVLAYCEQLQQELQNITYHKLFLIVEIDSRDKTGGEKNWQAVKQGIPLRLEIGPRDITNDKVVLKRRDEDPQEKHFISRTELLTNVITILDEMQNNYYQRALAYRDQHTFNFDNLADFTAFFAETSEETAPGFAIANCADIWAIQETLKSLKISARCIPLETAEHRGTCIFTGRPDGVPVIFAKSY